MSSQQSRISRLVAERRRMAREEQARKAKAAKPAKPSRGKAAKAASRARTLIAYTVGADEEGFSVEPRVELRNIDVGEATPEELVAIRARKPAVPV